MQCTSRKRSAWQEQRIGTLFAPDAEAQFALLEHRNLLPYARAAVWKNNSVRRMSPNTAFNAMGSLCAGSVSASPVFANRVLLGAKKTLD